MFLNIINKKYNRTKIRKVPQIFIENIFKTEDNTHNILHNIIIVPDFVGV